MCYTESMSNQPTLIPSPTAKLIGLKRARVAKLPLGTSIRFRWKSVGGTISKNAFLAMFDRSTPLVQAEIVIEVAL